VSVAASSGAPPEGRLARAEAEVTRWRENLDELRAERASLWKVLPIGAVLAVPAAFFSPWAGAGTLALAGTIYGTGLYLTATRVEEFSDYLRRAEDALKRERGQAHDQAAP
jgi:hypothetical protein